MSIKNYVNKLTNLLEKEIMKTCKLKMLLRDVYEYLDVENEGCTKEQYELVEKIRKVLWINKKHLILCKS